MEISLQTYDRLEGKADAIIYIQSQINQREGTQIDYGFSSEEERALFRKITSVSGMGASSARMILSSLSPSELKEAILCEDVTRLKSVKGIGLKSAQRLILELKDKFNKDDEYNSELFISTDKSDNTKEAMDKSWIQQAKYQQSHSDYNKIQTFCIGGRTYKRRIKAALIPYLPKYNKSTEISEGETPDILEACAIVRGLYLCSF